MIEIKIPTVGESILEVELISWFANDGDFVKKNQEIAEIESDKATLTLTAPENGNLKILVKEGTIIEVGSIAAKLDPSSDNTTEVQENSILDKKPKQQIKSISQQEGKMKITPLAKKKMQEKNIKIENILQGFRRISVTDVDALDQITSSVKSKKLNRNFTKEKMSQLRQKISQRLVAVKNETAMLTTFNEVDMSAVMNLRKEYQFQFMERHQIKLGFMSFFAKATTTAIKFFPIVNSMIDNKEIVSYDYVDLSIAVQTPKGLMVPVIRNVEALSLAEIEQQLATLAKKAREKKISIEEMSGGTFTITNGGVFGSMLSTPILNPPQSSILGIHNIVQRPVVINGKIEIRPIMYLALSYDHRLVDGKEAVGFLLKVKELIESPALMLFDGKDLKKLLLDL